MNITEEGLALIRRFEGFEAVPYQDAVDKWTVGYGHLVRPGETFASPLTVQQGEALLRADVEEDEDALERMLSVDLNPNQFSALVSFVFNEGAGRFRTSHLREFVNNRSWQQAADEFLKWVWGTQPNGKKVKLPGLVERRAAERALFLKPVIVADNGPVAV